jgi:predicted site-specific integrase-resolvase
MNRNRSAVYARYSTDRQSPLSIEDQIRKCRDYAKGLRWEVLEDHIYTDEAISATSGERPAFKALLGLAFSGGRHLTPSSLMTLHALRVTLPMQRASISG